MSRSQDIMDDWRDGYLSFQARRSSYGYRQSYMDEDIYINAIGTCMSSWSLLHAAGFVLPEERMLIHIWDFQKEFFHGM